MRLCGFKQVAPRENCTPSRERELSFIFSLALSLPAGRDLGSHSSLVTLMLEDQMAATEEDRQGEARGVETKGLM